MRILVLGAGVIGRVYGSKLLDAGHDVTFLARGRRLADLQSHGLILADAASGIRTVQPAMVLRRLSPDDHFDLVLVPVRSEQLDDVLPVLATVRGGADVLFFGNIGDHGAALVAALGDRAVFGFPAAGGTRNGPAVTYVLIRQQRTMLGEPDGAITPRIRRLQQLLDGAGFTTLISSDIGAWLVGHAAFVVPIAFALYRAGIDPARLAADKATMRLMVLATREAFTALRRTGNREIPSNLRALYSLPAALVIAYWRRVFNSPNGELWFGAPTRAAPAEMHTVARDLQTAIRRTGRPSPHLEQLLITRE